MKYFAFTYTYGDDAERLMDDDPYTRAAALTSREVQEWNPVSNIFV